MATRKSGTRYPVTRIEISRRTKADRLKPSDASVSVLFARVGKTNVANRARWFDAPTRASLWRCWRIINGLTAFAPAKNLPF